MWLRTRRLELLGIVCRLKIEYLGKCEAAINVYERYWVIWGIFFTAMLLLDKVSVVSPCDVLKRAVSCRSSCA